MNVAIDAAVCLLLVSAAVVGVTTVEQSPPATPDRADAVADALATTTAQVNYSLGPGVREMRTSNELREADRNATGVSPDSPELDRTAHGSLAGLLARAATDTSGLDGARIRGNDAANATPETVPITRTREGFRRGVREAVRARAGATVRVDTTWRPYPGAPVGGTVGVGPDPPSDGVHAATLVVPTGVEPIPASAEADFESLGAAVAARTVAVLAPPGPARVTLRGDGPAAALVRYRYARLAAATNASVAEPLATEDAEAANERVASALASRMAADLRTRYDAPSDAADAISVAEVRIVVRTWRPSAEVR